jgi:hypothetical protein
MKILCGGDVEQETNKWTYSSTRKFMLAALLEQETL